MLETAAPKKNKVSLADYDYRRDIENRLLMAHFTAQDLTVLEEILYSSLNIPIKNITTSLEISEKELRPILKKLSKTGLLAVSDDLVAVDKEMRKYYEGEIGKFAEDFCPGMEYLQGLLRKVPISILPVWYAIPRTSNNIFDSLVEKHLHTPQTFQRYLAELHFSDTHLSGIASDVFAAPDLKVRASELIEKYAISHEQLEECLLTLEFNFVCCLGYEKNGRKWEEVVTPFHEWREYLLFLHATETNAIADEGAIVRKRPDEFSFIQDMGHLLALVKKHPFDMADDNRLPMKQHFAAICTKCKGLKKEDATFLPYIESLIAKLRLLKLAEIADGCLYALEAAADWLAMDPEERAIQLYRQTAHQIYSIPDALDRHVREAEKSILRVLDCGWVYFDDFIKGVHVALSHEETVMLKKVGRSWKYALPSYSDSERTLIKATIFEWLFETGIVAVGTHHGKECFSVTEFGRSLFGA